jgi:phosphate transport system substrate-binding protein
MDGFQQMDFVNIAARRSGTGFKGSKSGVADIAAASRSAKLKEVNALADFADLTNNRSEPIMGTDGLAIIIHF